MGFVLLDFPESEKICETLELGAVESVSVLWLDSRALARQVGSFGRILV